MDRNRNTPNKLTNAHKSLSARRAWIEIVALKAPEKHCQSLSARRAWIEINMSYNAVKSWAVALRKESVDRNWDVFFCHEVQAVALRKESVDRNYIIKITGTAPRRSLSARRAWIEISVQCKL